MLSYYLDTYELPIVFIGGILCFFLLLFAFIKSASWLEASLKLSARLGSILIGGAILLSALIFFWMLYNIPDYLNDGKIQKIFILSDQNEDRLVVWYTRIDTPAGISTLYSHRLKAFSLLNRKKFGRLDLARRHPHNDYHIYGPFNHNKAWGYTKQAGMVLLDLFQPDVLEREENILAPNPELGNLIIIYNGRYYRTFDTETYGLYVFTSGKAGNYC